MAVFVAAAAVAGAAFYTLRVRGSSSPAVLDGPAELQLGGRPKPAGAFGDESATDIKDLRHSAEHPVDWPDLLKTQFVRLSPFALDPDNKRVILCYMEPTDLEDSSVTFFYQAQRKHIQRAIAVPYEEYCDAIEKMMSADEENVKKSFTHTLFLHSTGRCGSTLFSKLFAELGATHNLQEPDIYTSHTAVTLTQPELISNDMTRRLLRCSTYLLVEAARRTHPDATNIIIKTRSFNIAIAELIGAAVPEAKHAFLYRNAVDTIDSFCMAFFNSVMAKLTRRMHIDSLFLYKLTNVKEHLPVLAPLYGDERFPEELLYRLGAVGVTAMQWLSCMDKALLLQKLNFFNAVVRYEDLVESRMKIVSVVGTLCGLENISTSTEEADAVFDEDAHVAGSRTASSRRRTGSEAPLFVRDDDLKDLEKLLSYHEEIKTGDFVLPGTIG